MYDTKAINNSTNFLSCESIGYTKTASGSYGDAFVDHKKDADEKKMEVIQKWRTALNQVGSLSGLHVDEQ